MHSSTTLASDKEKHEKEEMTTPAVLYDHVPVAKDDVPIKNDHVSNPAVPRLTDEDDDDIDDIDDNRMETILEDSSMEYVLVAADTPHYDVDDDDDDVDVVRRKSRNERHSGVEDTNEETTTRTSLWLVWKVLAVAARTAARKSFAFTNRVTNRLTDTTTAIATGNNYYSCSSKIYQSYDWVSDTVIDDDGRRLILPGQLISLDDGNSSYNGTATTAAASSCSGDIMVSAIDLLATSQYSPYSTTTTTTTTTRNTTTTTTTTTMSVPMTLWKIAKRKTHSWMSSATTALSRTSNAVGVDVWEKTTKVVSMVYRLWLVSSTTKDAPPLEAKWEEQEEGKKGNSSDHSQITIELTGATNT